MTYPTDFTTNISGVEYDGNSKLPIGPVANALVAYERRTGVLRHKPQGRFIDPTSFSLVREAWKRAEGHYIDSGSGIFRFGTLSGVQSPTSAFSAVCIKSGFPDSFPDRLAANALARARMKLKNQQFNAGVAFGELRETAELFEHTAKRTAGVIRALRQRNPKLFLQALGWSKHQPSKSAANDYLEFTYGFRPFLSDLHGAAKALENRPQDHWKVTVKARQSQKLDQEYYLFSSNGNPDNSMVRIKGETGSYVRIDAAPQSPGLITLASLGVTNPVDIAWELLPLSFVVDWFFPLGNFLNGLDATLGWDILGFSQSNFYKVHMLAAGRPSGSLTTNEWDMMYQKVTLARQGSQVVPFPYLLDMGKSLTKGHVLNGLAIIRGALDTVKRL